VREDVEGRAAQRAPFSLTTKRGHEMKSACLIGITPELKQICLGVGDSIVPLDAMRKAVQRTGIAVVGKKELPIKSLSLLSNWAGPREYRVARELQVGG